MHFIAFIFLFYAQISLFLVRFCATQKIQNELKVVLERSKELEDNFNQ